MKKQKKTTKLIPLLVIVVLILLLLSYLIYKRNISNNIYNIITTEGDRSGWEVYTNKIYNYSFEYPSNTIFDPEKRYPGISPFVPVDEKSKNIKMHFSNINDEFIIISARDYFAPMINPVQWDEIDATINGNKIEAYKNKKVEVNTDKLLFRFKDNEKEIQVDFILEYRQEAKLLNNFYNILSSFQFTK